jgi:hypothetical protein
MSDIVWRWDVSDEPPEDNPEWGWWTLVSDMFTDNTRDTWLFSEELEAHPVVTQLRAEIETRRQEIADWQEE